MTPFAQHPPVARIEPCRRSTDGPDATCQLGQLWLALIAASAADGPRERAVASRIAVLPDPGDEIIVTEMEHHSNLVPWQLLCEERGAELKVVVGDGDYVFCYRPLGEFART